MTSQSTREQKKYEKLLAGIAQLTGQDLEKVKEDAGFDNLYSKEESFYEGQAVYNFYKARIQPRLEKGELPKDFDKRYREWRIKKCDNCQEEFAYAFNYEGVKFCSLDCLEYALQKIGLKFTRGRDLKKRWGMFFHPAIVPSSAFEALKQLYGSASASSFADTE